MGQHSTVATLAAAILATAAGSFDASRAGAEDLVIGLREVPLTSDPHFMTSPAAFQVNSQVFDALLRRDNDMVPTPALAASWQLVDDTTWIFNLRKDVKWHDGTPFTGEDVKFTYERARNVPNSPSSFATYLGPVKEVQIVDPHTIRILTDGPAPSLLEKLSYVLIVSKKNGKDAATADYHSGKAMIGTGPYKFVSWVQNEKTILEKNAAYWGPQPEWDKVTYRMIQNDSARVASLLAGDIDIAESIASQDIEALSKNPEVRVWKRLTSRIAQIVFDTQGGLAEGKITGPNGEKLEVSPLADVRVRRALADSIDVEALAERLYRGEAEPTAQFLPKGVPGHDDTIKLVKGSPERGKKLLEEAGYAGKFRLTLAVAQAFFPQSTQAAEAIAQSWTRAGVPTTVETMAFPVYVSNLWARKISVYIGAYQNSTGSADNFYPPYFHTKTGRWGSLNTTGYSNPKMDALIEEAASTMDDNKRAERWRAITRYSLEEMRQAPLYFFYGVHASKKDITMIVRPDRAIQPINVKRAKG